MKDWKSHCLVLGVRENVTAKELRRAYRRLALERHPDKHGNSARATQEFQQLNESYRHLLDGITEGLRTPRSVSPEPSWSKASTPQFRQAERAPEARRSGPPARLRKSSPWRVWVHAAALCSALLVISIGLEVSRGQPPARRVDSRDLSERAFCRITPPGGEGAVFDVTTAESCQASCRKRAGAACFWNGENLAGTASAPRAVVPPKAGTATKISTGDCRIALQKAGFGEQSYPVEGEDNCHVVCEQLRDGFARAGLHCKWNGVAFFDRSPYQPPEKDRLPATQPAPVADDYDPSTTCLISSVSEDGPSTQSIPHLNKKQCEERCLKGILANLQAEAECYFAGQRIKRYFPDPNQVYLQKHPDAAGEALSQ